MDLREKIAVVTGGANGIGAATCHALASSGATVVVADINMEAAQELVAQLATETTDRHMAYCVDVTQYDAVVNLFSAVADHYGSVDICVNNAGVMNRSRTKTADHDLDDWDRVIAINQTGVFYCLKAALPYLQNQNRGTIVNVASLAGVKASGYNLAYSASKFAVVGMTKSAAIEYARYNIRINAVCPGYVDTDMLRGALADQPNMEEKILAMTPMRKFGTPQEIAQAILWLTTDNCPYMTGQTMILDGGLSL